MTKAEEVLDALQGDCELCDGTYVNTLTSLATYTLALGASAPGDDVQFAWTCDKCGSTVFRP